MYEDFDIRDTTAPAPAAATTASLSKYRQQQVTGAKTVALTAMKNKLGAARAALAARVPTLRVEASRFGVLPEVVDSASARQFLTAASARPAEENLRGFLADNAALYGLTATEAADLVKFTAGANPNGNMSWVGLRQTCNGLPVFQGEIMAGFSPAGALARTTSNLAAGLDPASLPTAPVLTAAQAVSAGAAAIGHTVAVASLTVMSAEQSARAATLVGGPFSDVTKTELVYFPVEPGVATLAYSMTLWDRPRAYMVLVDAADGALLFRKCITQDQTQAVTYNVYTDDSPSPLSPTAVLPGQGTQPAGVARTDVSLIADDLNASPLGWITDSIAGAAVATTGNNCDAGLDAASPDGIDVSTSTVTYFSRPTTTNRTFSFIYNPPPGFPAGSTPDQATNYTATTSGSVTTNTITPYAAGAVTNLFFWTNRYHDRLYNLGFTEAFRNFQASNFGRNPNGATTNAINGNDAVSAQVHDYSGVDNANFSTPADGTPGRMQMYLFTDVSTLSRDGSLDGDVFLHEMTHGLSNRLHNNGSGLAINQSKGMGEGWSDFYARCILSTADENVDGLYASGGYVTYKYGGSSTDNYYYGIRRFPYAVISVKGANGKPHNPETFADVDPYQANLSDGAYAPAFNGAPTEVHNIGEVWCSMLLEMRERFIKRLGYADTVDANNNKVLGGNNRALQIVTDAMKLDVASPNMIQARDSIIAADNAGFGGADALDIRKAFAARGMGAGASTDGTLVVESFSPELALGAVTFTDTLGNNNGVAEPGEDLVINVPLTNVGAVGESANVSSGAYSGFVDLAANGGAGAALVPFHVPATATPGSTVTVPIICRGLYNSVTYNFVLNVAAPIYSFLENFDGVTAPALPSGWSTAVSTGTNAGVAWVTAASPTIDAKNHAFSPDKAGVSASAGGEASLFSTTISVPSAGSPQLRFKHSWDFETYNTSTTSYILDGAVLEIKIGAATTYTDIVTAGGSFAQNGYTGTLTSGYGNPIQGRPAWTGTSPGPVTTIVNLPAAALGQSVQLRWRLGFDVNSTAPHVGWRIDTVGILTGYAVAPIDSDGDGLQDGYETAHGLNPSDPSDASKDSDNDGMTNLQEYLAGTDPNDVTSVLKISQTMFSSFPVSGSLNFVIPSVLGKRYGYEYKNDLADPAWIAGAVFFNGTGGNLTLYVYPDDSGNLPGRFYRIFVVAP